MNSTDLDELRRCEQAAKDLHRRIRRLRSRVAGESQEDSPDLDGMALPERLVTLRGWRQLTQRELAEKSHLNVNTIINLEKGAEPRTSTLWKLATALDVPRETLTGRWG